MYRNEFTCAVCKLAKVYEREGDCGGTGYAGREDSPDRVCYDCAALETVSYMREHGRISLYLTVNTYRPEGHNRNLMAQSGHKLTNWTGNLSFHVLNVRKGSHNVAGSRYDCWINGPDGYVWHGVQYGENTQLCHLRRTKEIWAGRCGVRLAWPIKADPNTRLAEQKAA